MWGMFHSIMFCTVAFLAVMSHFKAMTTDPGAVPTDAEPVYNNLDNVEGDCDNIKEPLNK